MNVDFGSVGGLNVTGMTASKGGNKGKVPYTPPEIFSATANQNAYTSKSDVYSFGVTFFESFIFSN